MAELGLLWIAFFAPLIGFLSLLALGRYFGRQTAGIFASSAVALPFIAFCGLLYLNLLNGNAPERIELYRWIPIAGIDASVSLFVDHLALLMALIITGIGSLILVYSMGYMEDERDYVRYFASMNLFIFAMLLLILASDLLVLFVGWEGVGLASYLLIGFYYDRPSAASAAKKAFVVNRIGDAGLLLAMLLAYSLFGTGDMQEIATRAPGEFAVGAPLMTILTLLLMCGAAGKSAQMPLHVWLPDAMEGPTPVSALIHAATMVTAGVYLVVRLHDLFLLAPFTLQVIGIVGITTSLLAAFSAIGQTDLKRVLAYSTLSQLGLMFLACGAGAFYPAMFHLTTHAFVKGLLFLSAGNVVHMMHGNTDLFKMGGLAKSLPYTRWFFLLGALALSGLPPLALFFSKDLILENQYLTGHTAFCYIGMFISVLTSFYMMRAYFLTFWGISRTEKSVAAQLKEAPYVMLIPVAILGFFAITGGLLGFSHTGAPLLENFLSSDDPTLLVHGGSEGFKISSELILSIAASLLGLLIAIVMYMIRPHYFDYPLTALHQAFYFDQIYASLIEKPCGALAGLITKKIEPLVFEGSIQKLTEGSDAIASQLGRFQSGQIRSYIAWFLLGAALLLYFLTI